MTEEMPEHVKKAGDEAWDNMRRIYSDLKFRVYR